METEPKVSVVIPTHGRSDLLPRAVGSVMQQTHRNFELIVVDDNPRGERTKTQEALWSWRSDPRLRYLVNTAGHGCARARNSGLEVASGEWTTFLDDDDAYRPDKLARQLAAVRETGANVALCGLAYHAAGRARLRQCRQTMFTGDDLVLRAQAAAPAIFCRRIEGMRFDEEYSAVEDADFFFRQLAHWKLTSVPNVPAPLVDVLQQPTAARINTQLPGVFRGHRRLWYRHRGSWSRTARRILAARLWLLRASAGNAGRWSARKMLLDVGGVGELRMVANLWLRGIPGIRRWISV